MGADARACASTFRWGASNERPILRFSLQIHLLLADVQESEPKVCVERHRHFLDGAAGNGSGEEGKVLVCDQLAIQPIDTSVADEAISGQLYEPFRLPACQPPAPDKEQNPQR